MRARILLSLTIGTLLTFASTAGAVTPSKLQIDCAPNTTLQVDPVKAYGVSPSAHSHTEAGAAAFSAFMTLPSMISATTSCNTAPDHSAIWVPTIYARDGTVVQPNRIDYYLTNNYNLGNVLTSEPPNGLRMVVGDASCAGSGCPPTYQCPGYIAHTIPPAGACSGGGFQITSPGNGQCWNGLDSGPGLGGTDGPADAISNFTNVNGSACSGILVPQIQPVVSVPNAGVGGYLSSDVVAGTQDTSPGSTFHFDYVFGWLMDQFGHSSMGEIINRCLNKVPPPTSTTCAIDSHNLVYPATSSGSPDHTQPVVTG